ncbi:EexN family lipoprotein [Cronobacter sakazakii]|nr:EexN family lipoprotein [Cronobacter sakazakii]
MKVKRISIVMIGLLAVLSVSCKEKAKSVEYYLQHKDARMQMINACKNEPVNSEDCQNASAAQLKVGDSTPHF